MKFTIRITLLTALMMLFEFSARAGSITEEQAKAKAQSFLQTIAGAKRHAPARTQTELNITPSGQSALYVFNVGEQNGFVIVAADDRARSILGYADSGTFDVDNMPAALSEMLGIYARQIDMIGEIQVKQDSVSRVRQARNRVSSIMRDVAPLLTTTWDQGYPYNAYCPTLNDQTALTGCVATAMAQIAYYHKYPTSQVPSLASYISETNKINVSAWGATTFDWDNMLDSYSGQYTDAQMKAVARLMRYCGQAAQMDYGFTSGAYNGDALVAFKDKLGYNANATFKRADNYSADAWEDLIYKELSEGRPVYYSALNESSLNAVEGSDVSGHAFVIDGYQAEGNYFHVNWGWGGGANGYFNLFALDPGAPQSPATASGWHYQMVAIVGLSPETVNTAKLMKDMSGSWLITSTDDWNELSANLDTYNGGSFKLTTDISVTTMVGTESVPFSGTFDGQGHVLNVNIESGNWGTAPFNYVNSGTIIKNLKTQGTVRSYEYHSSGLIGGLLGNGTITITNCEVAVQLYGEGYGGGFIGHALWAHPVFYDCIFSGSINDCWDNHGCFVGWKEWESRPVYYNCLSIPMFLGEGYSCDFSHPGSGGGSTDHATFTNCYSYYAGGFSLTQGTLVSNNQLANGLVAHDLQNGSREWTTGMVWGQKPGTDALPLLTSDASKRVFIVTFLLDGKELRTILTNGSLGDKMPAGEDFGLKNATFTCNGTAFTSSTPINSDLTVTVTGTSAFTLTLNTPANGSISINNNSCMPGILKKVTAIPTNGYVVSAVNVTDANGKTLPVTQVSNNANEYVFAFPKSSVTVNAEFTAGEAEPTRFINGGLTLPSSWRNGEQHWTADTWMIWGNEYDGTDNVIVGAPPTDALGHEWYEEGYALTNSEADVRPNGNKIVWENHAASFRDNGNYDYFAATGSPGGDRNGDFYIRRVFTFNTQEVPAKLYMSCSYDDAPVEYYINGTLIYEDQKAESWYDGNHEVELTPAQISLIHTDGTPNVLAVHASQNWGGYHLDCGLYDPTALSYEVTSEQTVRVQSNALITGDVVIPETITANGVTYMVTELPDYATNDMPYMTSISIPRTITSIGTNVFWNNPSQVYVKSYIPIYQDNGGWYVMVAAPTDATEFELPMECHRIWNNAFKFTDKLTKLTLPRSLTYIGYNAFVGCTALTDIYSYARPVPQTEWNAFEGLDKFAITVHIYESALESYKQSWGEEFNYVTMPDPQIITLVVNVANAGTLRTLIEEAAAAKGSTMYDVTGLTVTGNINQDDLWTLSEMCTGVYSLATIDLGAATIEGNYIGEERFRSREKLTSIILPETLEYINPDAFRYCNGLTSIDIPASVKRIARWAFDCCENLATVTGMEGLSEVDCYDDWDPFWGTAITQPVYGGSVFLYMPPTVTGDYEMPAGIKMTAPGSIRQSLLSSITLPASLTDLGDDSFQDCPNLTDIYCYATTPPTCYSGVWDGFDRSVCTVHVPASAVEEYQNAEEWRDMGRIEGIITGELVDMTLQVATAGTLNDELFEAAVAEAQISDKVLIRNLTVTGSLNADDVAYLNTLPNTLYNMVMLDLSGATLAGNAITERMFYSSLYKSIKLPASVTSIATEAFSGSRRLMAITLPAAITTIEANTFSGCSALAEITFAENSALKRIEESAFNGLSSLTSIELPASLEYIGPFAFANTGLTSITIPDNVTELGHRSLQSCDLLKSIIVGNGITVIPDCWAEFSNSLEEVTIGKKVSSIRWRAFPGFNLKNVYCYAKNPPSWDDAFYDGINPNAVLHVFSNYVNRYQNAYGWQDFPNIVGDLGTYPSYDLVVNVTTEGTFSESLQTVMSTAGCEDMMDIGKLTVTGNVNNDDLYYFRDNLGAWVEMLDLSAVTVENNTINEYALYGCVFNELELPASLERIDRHALAHTGLTSITIPDGIVEMGDRLLQDCGALTSITFGNGITYIADCLAEDCNNLEEVTIGKKVREIRWHAFPGFNIKHVYCCAKNPPAWNDAFYDGINSDAVLHVYSDRMSRYQNAYGWKDFPNIVGDLGTYSSYDFSVNVSTMGNFSEALATAMTNAGCKDMIDIRQLTVTGSVNQDDLYYLRDNVGAYLDVLDLSAVKVEGNVLGHEALAWGGFEEIVLPSSIVTLQGWHVLEGCSNLKTIDIPSSVTYVGPRILYGATSLETVTGGNGVTGMEWGDGMYFDNCPNLKSPVILGSIMFRLPISTQGSYEVPDYVTTIARDAMWNVKGLTALTLPESIITILGNAFAGNDNLKNIYFYAIELPNTDWDAFNDFDKGNCTLHVYEEMVEVIQNDEIWSEFNIVGDLGAMPIRKPINEADYADLCAIFNTLGGNSWRNKWLTNKNLQIVSRWKGVTFDEDGYVTSIELGDNGLSGDIGSLTFSGLTKLTSLNLSGNALTGDIMSFKTKLPAQCRLYVERQNLGYVGEHTLYELCNYGGLPSIAYYRSESGTLASTLMGVGGICQFYHQGTDGGHDWEGHIHADGGTWNNAHFYWSSPVTLECTYPHRFTFTYKFDMGDANMDDVLNVLDLQTTLNYSNGQEWGLFNFYAADTYGKDKEINVQDIVSTVNILLAQDNNNAPARRVSKASPIESEACVSVENGQIVLYTTKPVAALDLRIAGVDPASLNWNTEDMGFSTAMTSQADGTHAIIYSMQPRQIEEGRTVLATFDTSLSPYLTSAVLSDDKARKISVGKTVPTGIILLSENKVSSWSITDISGLPVTSGTNATEADILKLVNSLKLHGVYILNTDGAKRKIMIK